ncbi:MAG: hypothetical protein HYV09_23830 [Deltaproteobacteria bacterium]|nr:hypothetical protein [Deltaproteobacteria bacterium]
MDRRLAVTLGIAALAHAVAWAIVRAPVRQAVPPVSVDGSRDAIELLDDPGAAPEPTSTPAAPAALAQPARTVPALAPKPVATSPEPAPATSPAAATSATEIVASAAPSGSGAPATGGAGGALNKPKFPSLIDLDSPGSHAVIFPSSSTTGAADAPSKAVAAAAKLDAQLKSALDAKDTSAGTGFGGPVATAAHTAAGMSGVMGWATFDVQTDALGAVTMVRVVDFGGGGDAKSWQRVAKDLHASMDGRKLKVPTGAGGVAVRVHIEAVMRLPSGATTGISPVASAGSVGIGFDLSDIGQKPMRRVSVRIVGESRI